MGNILQQALPKRRLPDWRAVQLAARVPIKILRQARDVHTNTSDEIYFSMLDSIGIDAVCDLISQGCFTYDVAMTLDIPPTKFREWIDSDHVYGEKLEVAEELSADAFLSIATEEVMNVTEIDVDGARVAKVKADHMRWLASRKDRTKYGDQVSHKHSGGQTVEYRISMSAPIDKNIIDVNI